MSSTTSLAQTYQKKTDKEHVLDNPDTYTGSMEMTDTETFVFNEEKNCFDKKTFEMIPGLYKLFDEAIVNCRDHAVRMENAMFMCKPNTIPLKYIDVSISDDGVFTFVNDGNGIDIAEHPDYNLWIPEMIFFHLRTGTNYNKSEKKIVGGKNGFGVKLIFIWSEFGYIETIDHVRQLKYTQKCSDNLNVIEKPVVKKCRTKPYTKIVFKPDYKRLGISGLTKDMIALLKRRIYDIAAVTSKQVSVKLNSSPISVKHFQQYVDMYIGPKSDTKRVYEIGSERWEYGVSLSPSDEFQQVSFVNGIYTGKGGKHVDYILNQIVRKLTAYISKKKKIDVKSTSIKEQLFLFLRCDVVNPGFDSQTKEYLTTAVSKFGSKVEVSDKFVEKIAKMGVMDKACDLTAVKQNDKAKKTDGAKSKCVRGIPKLVDANYAGTKNSHECTIIFCEGDSAKAGIVSGLSKEDRNYIGVYPMKGKMFNVRGESIRRISENKEIVEIKQIIGLETGKQYKNAEDIKKHLRYGKLLFMTDQDLDGSHIKGLGINLFHCQWKSLIMQGIIGFMNTPILKARKGSSEIVFYNDGEYLDWKKSNNDGKGWKVKYYKGLGTSTAKEFKEYFKEKKIVTFVYTENSDDAIDMVFNKKRAEDRKEWLGKYERESFLDTSKTEIPFEDFINFEMNHFSKYDCDRSIPNLMDGLKTSQRKILFAAFKKGLKSEIKVAQFAGYVSEHSAYHHGEQSLMGAIVGMAQDYVGSNNIGVLMPNGQFGTRLAGGKDSASERYIFTQLNSITRKIYPQMDDNVLKYLDDDGTLVEPIYYAPIIPMVLVNGSRGIGTGFSTDIMSYNPIDIINCIRALLGGKTLDLALMPYYEGFKGSITPITDSKFLIKGKYDHDGVDKIHITELPIGTWTDDYKADLEYMMSDKDKKGKKKAVYIKDYNDMSTDKVVDITITLQKGILGKLETAISDYGCTGIEKAFKLFTTHTNTNMYMFDASDELKKYTNAREIIEDYFEVRLDMYDKRKKYIINSLEAELIILSNKAKYIQENLTGTIDLRGKKKSVISELLKSKQYSVIDDDDDYKYLVKMPMDSVSQENVEKLMKEQGNKELELSTIKATTIQNMWKRELDELEKEYLEYRASREKAMDSTSSKKKKKNSKKKKLVVNSSSA